MVSLSSISQSYSNCSASVFTKVRPASHGQNHEPNIKKRVIYKQRIIYALTLFGGDEAIVSQACRSGVKPLLSTKFDISLRFSGLV